jgi:predicted TIM-barrel fold metal-dependent hydrolase
MTESADFLRNFPEVPVVIDHAGCPYDQSESGLQLWMNGLASLAELPNLHIKLSGFGMYDKDWSSESTQLIFDTILENFSSNRIMWGSNFPVERLMNPYRFCVSQLLKWLAPLSEEEKNRVASETAKNFYRIGE